MVCQRIFEVLKRIFLIFVCEHRDFYLNDFQPRTGACQLRDTQRERFDFIYLKDK